MTSEQENEHANADGDGGHRTLSSEQTRAARAELETIITSLGSRGHPALARLITYGRLLLDESRRLGPPSELARLALAEIEMLVALLPAHELPSLVRHGGEMLDEFRTGRWGINSSAD